MKKHLWELNLIDIPCGWENTYQEALKKCPNGMPLLIKGTKFLYHPVKYRQILLDTFSKSKEACNEITKNECLNQKQQSNLLEHDIILFNVLFDWCQDSYSLEKPFFDISKLKEKHAFKNVAIYFAEDDDPYNPITQYYHLKYYRVNNAIAE
ncbi:hypothetical protein EDD68_10770 [Melghiribacillus thermohalophilus]|uniref:Uncharacterized protein n=1 Tax=Melghiribacillus thermohalophilus TaxID=1324956 RepID=A0A4R3N5K1_9BACI|nr:hypothetical protein [Melghiribacillus thermohalophilus]TCT23356.1 hypothetical protein EDD68_10770 [Melghiribacillus thermohalophilus]